MREQIANVVHGVLERGLVLRDRVQRGETLSLLGEQANLGAMLLDEREAQRWPEYGGEDASVVLMRPGGGENGDGARFLGARYALVCWLDELFILDSHWQSLWNEHKLEVQLYSTNDRAWHFWEQARLAASRGAMDALEVYYLCVMLGFSGDLLDYPEKLAEWVANTRALLSRSRESGWRPPVGIEPATRVHPLRGRNSLQQMLLIACAVLLTLVPVVAVMLARRLT